MPSSQYDASAAKRKRFRDRVAQQRLRHRRSQYVQDLEQQVKHCHELHGSQDNENMRTTIRELHAEVTVLREQQGRLLALLTSCENVLRPQLSIGGGENSCNRPLQALENLHAMVDGPSSVSQRPFRPPGPSQTEEHQIAHSHSDSIATVISAKSPRESCMKPAEVSIGVNDAFWFQSDGFQACDALDASTIRPVMDFEMSEIDNPSAELVGDASDSIYSSFITEEYTESTKDIWAFQSSMPNILPNTLSQGYPGFLGDTFGSCTPFQELVSWSGPGRWAPEKDNLDLPIWARVPLRDLSLSYHLRHCPWDANLQAILDAPDNPSPLDLLFGSRHNLLANLIQRNVKKWYYGVPERLAIGWLAYSHIKWRTQPTFERFLRLPDCLKPTPEQTLVPHPGCLDMVLWKKLRLNLLDNYKKYDVDAFMRVYCRCLKLRWPRDEEVLDSSEGYGHTVRPGFLKHFMNEGAWGLKNELLRKYPEVFEGLDLRNVLYDEHEANVQD